jgi:hypothetical protein
MNGRRLALTSALLLGATAVFAQQDTRVQTLLEKARAALGGEARLSAVQTFSASGTITIGNGPTKTYGTFKIHCRLRDAWIRSRSVSPVGQAGGASVDIGTINPLGFGASVGGSESRYVNALGFDGTRLIYQPNVTSVRLLVPAVQSEMDTLYSQAQREFARVTLGLFAASFAAVPLQFAPAPGDPTSLTVTGSGDPFRVTFNPLSHLPVQVDRIEFSRHRQVGGVMVPFRMLVPFRTIGIVGSASLETWDVKEFTIDEPIAPSVFRR